MTGALLTLTASEQRAYDRLADDLQRVFAARLVALVAYQANASVAFVSGLAAEDLRTLGPLVGAWHRDGLATPLVMTPGEFERSLDAFPLEYQAILERHVVIAGHPPFAGVTIHPEDLRRACEAQARSHLIHLRQGWLQTAGHDGHLADLVVRSAGPFHLLLSNVARLHGAAHETDQHLVQFAETTIGLQTGLVSAVLDLQLHPAQGQLIAARMSEYLAAAERLWDFVDTWRAK